MVKRQSDIVVGWLSRVHDFFLSRSALNGVGAAVADDRVVARAAVEGFVDGAADQNIIAVAAAKFYVCECQIGRGLNLNRIVPRQAFNDEMAAGKQLHLSPRHDRSRWAECELIIARGSPDRHSAQYDDLGKRIEADWPVVDVQHANAGASQVVD